MNQEQETALREYLQEAIVPLIEQVLVKKLGQAMSFATEQLIQPKREWQGLTKEEAEQLVEDNDWYNDPVGFCFDVEAKLKDKNT